jgi:Amt family ammonium transporter
VCSNIPTIVAGSLAERTFVDTYMFFALLMTGFIYPVAAAWVWGGGWLKVMGFKDFAGAGVVHLLGGTCGMVGTVILGPRLGVFGTNFDNKDITKSEIPAPTKVRTTNKHHLDSFETQQIDFQMHLENSVPMR